MLSIKLSESAIECVGCGVCAQKCPSSAIRMKTDELGFSLPEFDSALCKNCGQCEKLCPQIDYSNKNSARPECYAAVASNEIRNQSTAGGAFSILAQFVLNNGGYVCGVEFKDFKAGYVMIDNADDLPLLQGAKYIEAATGDIFSKVEEKLKEDKNVLFCGTPCHIEALYRFLGNHYETLTTVDFVCHGVSSPAIFNMEIEEIGKETKVVDYKFSSKKLGFRPDISFAEYEDKKSLSNKDFPALHNSCASLRKSCYDCRFAELPRVADITLGIFYGVETFDVILNDGKGVSMILVNNTRGRMLIRDVKNSFTQLRKVPLKTATDFNRFFGKYDNFSRRERLLALSDKIGYSNAKKFVIDNKYDVAVIANWSSCNYGAHLTHYALYKVISDMGLQVLMVEKPNQHPWPPISEPILYRDIPYENYALSHLFDSLEHMNELNRMTDTFVVGSDQVWNYNLFGHADDFYSLSFVDKNKLKISYATSFGDEEYTGKDSAKDRFSDNIKRFDHISVREESGVEICRDVFYVEAEMTLDPLFIADTEIYNQLIENSKAVCKNDFAFVYIHWPSSNTEQMLEDFVKRNNNQLICCKEALLMDNVDKKSWSLPTISNAYVEDWLYYIKNSKFVITDSYQAICMAIIFKKDFLAVINPEIAGAQQIISLLKLLSLDDFLVTNIDECYDNDGQLKDNLVKNINYDEVYEKLNSMKAKSLAWLKNALGDTLSGRKIVDFK